MWYGMYGMVLRSGVEERKKMWAMIVMMGDVNEENCVVVEMCDV